MSRTAFLLLVVASSAVGRNNLALTPPMGWMSWEMFRCNLATPLDDCTDKATTACISEVYQGITDALVSSGLAAAGYASVHMDDCWEETTPPRDPVTQQLRGDHARFPAGMKALGDYVHAANLSFAMYTAEAALTCGGYPASKGFEALDAKTFADWGVDYLKVDGCAHSPQEKAAYSQGYAAMGAALEASGRRSGIVYSCSWPAYLGRDESVKPFGTLIMDGCNLWRNSYDIQCDAGSLLSIIDYFGNASSVLAPWAGPGHWHDPDMLLIGNGCITEDEERTQMAIWSILAGPLIMGNDPRNIPDASKAILTCAGAIAISQDPLGQMGVRLDASSAAPQQRWARVLANGDVAVALFNKGDAAPVPPNPPPPCDAWTHTTDGYYEACGSADGTQRGNLAKFENLTAAAAQAACCGDAACAGFSFGCIDAACARGSGYYKRNSACGFQTAHGQQGFVKPGTVPRPFGSPADVTIEFAEVNLFGNVSVTDVWSGAPLGVFSGSFTARQVAYHGTALLRLARAA